MEPIKKLESMPAYDDCTYCGGRVTERLVTKACWWGDQLIALIEDVPAGVCEQCGERYYKANVLQRTEELLSSRDAFSSVAIPVTSFRE
jgi:YgiT-type zinc finger domain-containing protein